MPSVISEFGPPVEGLRPQRKLAMAKSRAKVEFARLFAPTDLTKSRIFFTPLQITTIRNSNETLTLGMTIL
jgi:hypothetical protein